VIMDANFNLQKTGAQMPSKIYLARTLLTLLLATLFFWQTSAAYAYDVTSGIASSIQRANIQAAQNAARIAAEQKAAQEAAAKKAAQEAAAKKAAQDAANQQSGSAPKNSISTSQGNESRGNAGSVDLNSSTGASANADKASGDQSMAAATNGLMGAAMIAGGIALLSTPDPTTTTKVAAAFLIANGLLGLAQMGMTLAASDDNKKAGNNFKTGGGLGGSSSGGNSSSSSGGPGSGNDGDDPYAGLPNGTKDQIEKLAGMGYKIDLKNATMTTPDGRKFSAANGTSPSSIESQLGLPPGTAEKGQAMMEEISKHYGGNGAEGLVAASGGTGSATNGGAVGSTEGYDGSDARGSNTGNTVVTSTVNRDPASLVAGLSTKYRGEPIGVASDDIFAMVSRRYQLKGTQDSFITIERPAPGVFVQPGK
jgi:hypothetical protein